MSISTSQAMTTICRILSSKVIQRPSSSQDEEEPHPSVGTTPPQERGPWGLRALGFTDLQIAKEEVVIRQISKDATGLYEFRKTANVIDRS